MLSEYLSNQNTEDMEPDDIFRNGVTKLNLMFENVLNDAILLETIGTLEIQDVLSSFTKDEINDILQNIPDQKVRDYLKYAIKKTLKKCRKKYKWYNKLNKKWKRIRKEYPYDTTSWRQWDERS